MFAFLIRACQLLSTLSALMAPIAIVHWLISVLALPGTDPVIQLGQTVFNPLNAMVDAILPFNQPKIDYNGRLVDTIQAITAIVGIAMFFVLIQLGKELGKLEQRLNLMKTQTLNEAAARKHRANLETQRRQQAQFKDILVYISFPFNHHPELGRVFQQFSSYGGRELPSHPDTLVLGFQDVTLALTYTIQLTNLMENYYRQLRPTEPKPPFHFVVHSIKDNEPYEETLSICTQLSRYAGPFQTLLSQALQQLMLARDIKDQFKRHSMGFYTFPGGIQQEVFQLKATLPDSKVLF